MLNSNRKNCSLCKEPLADWERELHDSWHRGQQLKAENEMGWFQSFLWGIAFASPFIIAAIIYAVRA